MRKAQKAIDPSEFTAIPRIKDFINLLPKEVRVCSQHGEGRSRERLKFASPHRGEMFIASQSSVCSPTP
jgi:hypothetical protein